MELRALTLHIPQCNAPNVNNAALVVAKTYGEFKSTRMPHFDNGTQSECHGKRGQTEGRALHQEPRRDKWIAAIKRGQEQDGKVGFVS